MLKPSSAEVSAARDARNRKFIARMKNFPWKQINRGITPDWRWQLAEGTADEREVYVKKVNRRALIVAVLVMPFVIALNCLGPAINALWVVEKPAGQILSIQLHEKSTTVETSNGTYQVQGLVSGNIGSPAKLVKKKTSEGLQISLCVNSECYWEI